MLKLTTKAEMQTNYTEISFFQPVRLAKIKTYGNGEVLTKHASHMWTWGMFTGTTSWRIIWSCSIKQQMQISFYNNSLLETFFKDQGFSTLALLTFQLDNSLLWVYPVPCRTLTSTLGSAQKCQQPPLPVMTTKKVFQTLLMMGKITHYGHIDIESDIQIKLFAPCHSH